VLGFFRSPGELCGRLQLSIRTAEGAIEKVGARCSNASASTLTSDSTSDTRCFFCLSSAFATSRRLAENEGGTDKMELVWEEGSERREKGRTDVVVALF
jgi:hypothetical protein